MKKILFILLTVISVSALGQGVDSTRQNIRLTGIQFRDWQYCLEIMYGQGELFDPLVDSVKARVHVNPGMAQTAIINIDSVERREILALHNALRMEFTGSFSWDRVNTAIRALGDPYINSQLAVQDNAIIAAFTTRITTGARRLKGIRF